MSTSAPATPWVLSPARDLLLFVATPVLIVPIALLVLHLGVASREIQYFVLAFGAMGHNLPGMLRAYGDRALFRRFKWRFILAPIVFVGLCVGFALQGSQAIVVLAFFWSVWHALMQIYGFMRIYDARVGATFDGTARLDLLLCLSWFGGAVVFSDPRLFYIQEMLVGYGVPPLSPGVLPVLRIATGVLLAVVTVVHTAHRVLRARAGKPVNPVKDLLIVSSIGFWWAAQVLVEDVLLGLILFEVFHDVQYLAIVWIFNRRRVETDPGVGAFTRFVFRRSWGLIGIYVGLVLAYGAFIPLTGHIQGSPVTALVCAAIIQSSALLHYYYDGFIWKVREESTRRSLGIEDGTGGRELRVPWHALKWSILLVPAAAMFWLGEKQPSLADTRALVASTPGAARAHFRVGESLNREGRHLESLPWLERALALDAEDPEVADNLAVARLEAGKDELRAQHPKRARELLELAYSARPTLVNACNQDGLERRGEGKMEDALVEFHAVLTMDPNMADAHLNLALVYREMGRLDRALYHARKGVALRPMDPRARHLLGTLEGK